MRKVNVNAINILDNFCLFLGTFLAISGVFTFFWSFVFLTFFDVFVFFTCICVLFWLLCCILSFRFC